MENNPDHMVKLDPMELWGLIDRSTNDERNELYNWALGGVKALPEDSITYIDEPPLSVLSHLVNLIISHEEQDRESHDARENRPLSLLQVVLYITDAWKYLEPLQLLGPHPELQTPAERSWYFKNLWLRWHQLFEDSSDTSSLRQAIQFCEKLREEIESHFGMFIVTQKMDGPSNVDTHFDDFYNSLSGLVRAAETQVALIHPNLREFLTRTEEGREVMAVSPKRVRELAGDKTIPDEIIQENRVASLQVASRCEYVMLEGPETKFGVYWDAGGERGEAEEMEQDEDGQDAVSPEKEEGEKELSGSPGNWEWSMGPFLEGSER